MRILIRGLIRDIRSQKGQFIAVFIVIMLGASFYVAFNDMYRNLQNASDEYFRSYRLSDVWIDLYRAPKTASARLRAIDEVKQSQGRIVQDVSFDDGSDRGTIRLITLPDSKKEIIDDVMLVKGKYFSGETSNECLVEEQFFKARGLKIGDFLYPVINGQKVKLKISAEVKSPEYLYSVKDSSELLPDNRRFGVVYIKESFGEGILGSKGSANNIEVRLKKGADIKDTEKKIRKVLDSYGVKAITDRDSQISAAMLKEEIKKLKQTGGAFPVMFFIVASVILYITTGRMVQNQRMQIGVLKANGFKDIQLFAYYMSFSGLAALTGSLTGVIAGTFLGKGLTSYMNIYFNLPDSGIRVYYELIVPAVLITMAFSLFAGFNACRAVFKINPSEAMRPDMPVSGKGIMLERIDFLWKRLSYLWKVMLRNMFRYKRRVLLTSIGIVFSSAVVIISFSMNNSIDFLINQQYRVFQSYDIKVTFNRLVSVKEAEGLKNIGHIVSVEPVLEGGVQIKNNWISKDVSITAVADDAVMYRPYDSKGSAVKVKGDGIIIPERLSESMGLGIGDSIKIKLYYPGMKDKTLRITGISKGYIGQSLYTSLEGGGVLLGEGPAASGAVIRLDSMKNEAEVLKKLREFKNISSTVSRTDSMNALIKNMGAETASVGMLIVFSAILLVAVIYNTTAVNIFERLRELSTLKVLGFTDSEVKRFIFSENYIIAAIGLVFGIPLGIYLGGYMMEAYSTDTYSFPYVVSFSSYVYTVLLTIGFTMMSNLLLTKKIKRISLTDVLKNVD